MTTQTSTRETPTTRPDIGDIGEAASRAGEAIKNGIANVQDRVVDAVDDMKDALSTEDERSADEVAPRTIQPEFFAATQRGALKSKNEDNFMIAELQRGLRVAQSSAFSLARRRSVGRPQGWLFAVADGGSALDGGEVVSHVAINTMANYAFGMMPWTIERPGHTGPTLARGFRMAMNQAELNVRGRADEQNLSEVPETTLTIGYVAWPNLYVGHVGNSRGYLYRDGELIRLTLDHVRPDRMGLNTHNGETEPESGLIDIELSNALGGDVPRVDPELRHTTLGHDDVLFFCTDGVTNKLEHDDLLAQFEALHDGRHANVADAAKSILDQASLRGGEDDMTVALVRFKESTEVN